MSALRRRHVAPRFRPARLVAVGLLSLVVVLAPHSRAHAEHPIVTRALGLVDEADFPGALATFREAEERTDLSREDLATMYAHRALVFFAQRDGAAMRADLRRWLVLAPGRVVAGGRSTACPEAGLRDVLPRASWLDLRAVSVSQAVRLREHALSTPPRKSVGRW